MLVCQAWAMSAASRRASCLWSLLCMTQAQKLR